jgi:molybdopterin biosynthesis enzyme MoaB
MRAWINNSLWLVTEKPSPTHPSLGEVHGYTEPYKKRIVIDSTLDYNEKLETYLHEFLHAAGTEVDIEILYGGTADEDLVNDIISTIISYLLSGLAMYRRNRVIGEKIITTILSKALSDYCTDDEIKELASVYTEVIYSFILTLF